MLQAILGTSPLSENQKRINQTTHPLTTLTQLFFLVVKEEGTKVEFKDHCIHFMRPIMGQAVARIRDGTSFVDLKKLRTSIDEVVKMYPPNEYPEICHIFDLAILGLTTHSNGSYSSNPPAQKVIRKILKAAKEKQGEYKAAKENRDLLEVQDEVEKIMERAWIHLQKLAQEQENESVHKLSTALYDIQRKRASDSNAKESSENVSARVGTLLEDVQQDLNLQKENFENSSKAKKKIENVIEKFKEAKSEFSKLDDTEDRSENEETDGSSDSDEFEREDVKLFEDEGFYEAEEVDEPSNQLKEIWRRDEIQEFLAKAEFVKLNLEDTNGKAKIIWQNKVRELEALVEGKIELYRYVFTKRALKQF
ncbi:MAG: hypothetical protein CK425_06720 [Parachlamydia sp.]|nr:MAG: hypothetical protein CK425_06720 [Parachlamydia sp.]